ncbi:MAG TPA: PKD domain-containing protein [Solirubrobacterales bacterium]
MFERRRGRRRISIAPATIAAAVLFSCVVAAPAGAVGFGQIEAWGAAGTGPGQFNEPAECALFGVDPVDGGIYVGDLSVDNQSCRLQKLSPAGKVEASVAIPRFGAGKTPLGLHGVAIDHGAKRIYVLEGGESLAYTAKRILIYSIEPSGSGQLVPPAGGPASLTLPSGSQALRNPTSITVDPSNGDLVILAEDPKKEHAVIQRIGADDKTGARFVDLGNVLRPPGEGARAIAVGPDGTTYTLTGNQVEPGSQATRAWELPTNLASVKAVSGFAAAAESEDWKGGLLKDAASVAVGGPQISISPDGQMLYWKENQESSSSSEPGVIAVRGYSLVKGATSVVYGGHPYEEGKGVCAIGTGPAPIAATGEKLVVFDHAFPLGGGYGPPRVVTFGPGGSGCNAEVAAKLALDGVEEPVSVQKGVDVVSFDASESELGGQIEKVEWEFGDGESEEVVGPDPALSTTHRYLHAGTFTATVRIKLVGPEGPTGEASGMVEVGAASPQAFLDLLEPSGFSVAAGGTVVFDASESWDPTGAPAGGECTQATGCPGSSEMASYAWSFGDGSAPQTTTVPTVSHQFANPDSAPLLRLVTLTVESVEGQTDTDTRLITVRGTPGPVLSAPAEALLAPPAAPSAPTPPGRGKPGSKGGRHHKPAVRCRRLKKASKRRKCARAARAHGGHGPRGSKS